jgi:peptide chain release factor subunit 1
VQGNEQIIHKEYSVDLPNKHNKGGQSSRRFARLAEEPRHVYLTKIAEMCKTFFLDNNKLTVKHILLAGNGYFPDRLINNEYLDDRLRKIILPAKVDIQYAGRPGLREALMKGKEIIGSVRYNDELKWTQEFFRHIAEDTGKYCYGLSYTIECLKTGAIEVLLIGENNNNLKLDKIKLPELRNEIINYYVGLNDPLIEIDN